MSELLKISNKTNIIVYYLNDNYNTDYTDIQDCVKKLILEKYNSNNNNNNNQFDNFNDFIKHFKDKINSTNSNSNPSSNNIDILNKNTQYLILNILNYDDSFENFIKSLILKKANSNSNAFKTFEDFYKQTPRIYYSLAGLISFYKDKDISQMKPEEIISRFENLPQSEKNKFDLFELSSLNNRNLELLLINQVNANVEIKDKNDKFKTYFKSLFFNNENKEMSDDEFLNYFSENYANSKKKNIY